MELFGKKESAAPKVEAKPAPVAVKEVKAPKAPKAPAKARVVSSNHEMKISIVKPEKIEKYSGQRGTEAKKLVAGKTVAEYLAAGGSIGFLRFFIKDGVVTLA